MLCLYPRCVQDRKLSNKAGKLHFIGYSLQTKRYHIFDERTSKILVHWDVIFNESDFKCGCNKTKGIDEVTASHDQIVVPEGKEPTKEVQLQEKVIQEYQHRYPRRQRTAPVIIYEIDELLDIAFLDEVQMEQPETIEAALKDKYWKEAADSEYQSLLDNETLRLVKLPAGRKPIGCKWIFKTKRTSDSKVEHYKARPVAI